MKENSWAEQESAFFGTPTSTTAGGSVPSSETNGGGRSRMKKLARGVKSGVGTVSRRIGQTVGSHTTYPAMRRPHVQPPNQSPHSPIAEPRSPAPTPEPAPTATSSRGRNLPSFPSLTFVRRWVADTVSSCRVCGKLTPNPYRYHPFWTTERICAHHKDVTQCSGCNRFETLPSQLLDPSKEFVNLEDNGRKLCPACTRTIIVDSSDLKVVWDSVMLYFDHGLGIYRNTPRSKERMTQIPILAVEHVGLNDPSVQGSGHGQGNTRGLCMYEYRHHPLGGGLRNMFNQSSRWSRSRGNKTISSLFDFASESLGAGVTAILCLRGLPRDLAGSILAHEATHAWFKLHPRFDPTQTMPLQIEEGCCQLMAYQYLNHLEESDPTTDKRDYGDDGEPTDKRLRQYFRNHIETDTSEVYGDGFRLAAVAFAKLGCVTTLLEYVAENKSFPR